MEPWEFVYVCKSKTEYDNGLPLSNKRNWNLFMIISRTWVPVTEPLKQI